MSDLTAHIMNHHGDDWLSGEVGKLEQQIADLTARLEAGGEPVCWVDSRKLSEVADWDITVYGRGGFDYAVPLFTTPPAVSTVVAAGQAREMKLREALCHIQQVACSESPELGISTDALALPHDTTALREVMLEAIEYARVDEGGHYTLGHPVRSDNSIVDEIIGGGE